MRSSLVRFGTFGTEEVPMINRFGCFPSQKAALCIVSVFLAGALAGGQSNPANKTTDSGKTEQPSTTLSVQVKVVNVLATVRDKHGKIVNDLGKDDFTLTEDGRPQSIHYFTRESDLPLTLGLLVDTSLSQRRVLDQERSASHGFLDQMMRADKDKGVHHPLRPRSRTAAGSDELARELGSGLGKAERPAILNAQAAATRRTRLQAGIRARARIRTKIGAVPAGIT